MQDGWTAEVTVSADASKVPDGPIEAAKYAMDQVTHLAATWIKVEHHEGGMTETWLVDTSSGEVTRIGMTNSDPDREDADEPESVCDWATGTHYGGVFKVIEKEYGEVAISCGNHLTDTVSGVGTVTVLPYEKDGD